MIIKVSPNFSLFSNYVLILYCVGHTQSGEVCKSSLKEKSDIALTLNSVLRLGWFHTSSQD